MTTRAVLNETLIEQTREVIDSAIAQSLQGYARPRAVVVSAPAGAGKSELIRTAVERARRRNLRVVVGTPTNEQAFGLVRRLAGKDRVTFVPASGVSLPDGIAGLEGVEERPAKEATHQDLVVGTLAKLGDAHARGDLRPFDVLMIDEAYQADSMRYFAVAGLAEVHLLVGDSGQISPFSTIADPYRWRGLAEDPLQTAVGVLCRNHPKTDILGLPISRRLDRRAVRIAQSFYPHLRFGAAVEEGRRIQFRSVAGKTGDAVMDRALETAGETGWAHVRLPAGVVMSADPQTVEVMVRLVQRLLQRQPQVWCERYPQGRMLQPGQIAVGVSHNDQKDLLKARLLQCGLGAVVVETANKLQGLEYEVVFVWHPLAGLPEPDGFHLDPGRLCVLMTRHRQACVVVGRVGDEWMLQEQVPPATPAYLGECADPVLDGWEIHRQIFAALEAVEVRIDNPE